MLTADKRRMALEAIQEKVDDARIYWIHNRNMANYVVGPYYGYGEDKSFKPMTRRNAEDLVDRASQKYDEWQEVYEFIQELLK